MKIYESCNVLLYSYFSHSFFSYRWRKKLTEKERFLWNWKKSFFFSQHQGCVHNKEMRKIYFIQNCACTHVYLNWMSFFFMLIWRCIFILRESAGWSEKLYMISKLYILFHKCHFLLIKWAKILCTLSLPENAFFY